MKKIIMKIKLTPEQMQWCKDLAIKRSGSMNHSETKNSINCFKSKDRWHRHYVGALGELAYSIYSGKEVDTTTIGRGDEGIDFEGWCPWQNHCRRTCREAITLQLALCLQR
mgnify:CR=1 FL=1